MLLVQDHTLRTMDFGEQMKGRICKHRCLEEERCHGDSLNIFLGVLPVS